MSPNHQLFAEYNLNKVGTDDRCRLHRGRVSGHRNGGYQGGGCELEVSRYGEEEGGEGSGGSHSDGYVKEESRHRDSGLVGVLGVDGDQVKEVIVPQLQEYLPHVPVFLQHHSRSAHSVHFEALAEGSDGWQVVLQQYLEGVVSVGQ